MSHIQIKAIDQNIEFKNAPRIYSGDINTDYVNFEFDEVWDGFIKTAVFYRTVDNPYFQVLKDDECVIPKEVLTTAGKVYMGVVGVLDNKVLTSEVIAYEIGQGIMWPSQDPPIVPEPSPDIWQQILSELNNIRKLAEEMNKAQTDFTNKITQDQEAFKTQMANTLKRYYEELKAISANFMSLEDVDEICGGNYDPIYDDYNVEAMTNEEILALLI